MNSKVLGNVRPIHYTKSCYGVVKFVQETAHKEVNLSLIQEAQKKRQMKQVHVTLLF